MNETLGDELWASKWIGRLFLLVVVLTSMGVRYDNYSGRKEREGRSGVVGGGSSVATEFRGVV